MFSDAYRLCAKDRKELRRNAGGTYAFNIVASREERTPGKKCRDLLERLALLLPVDEIGHGHVARLDPFTWIDTFEDCEAVGFGKLQRSQQHRIDDAEHRGSCANAECEG